MLDQALSTLEELGDDHCAAYVRQTVGELHLRYGDMACGRVLLTHSMQVQERLGDLSAVATIAALLTRRHC